MYYYWVIGRGYVIKEEFALEDLKMVNFKQIINIINENWGC